MKQMKRRRNSRRRSRGMSRMSRRVTFMLLQLNKCAIRGIRLISKSRSSSGLTMSSTYEALQNLQVVHNQMSRIRRGNSSMEKWSIPLTRRGLCRTRARGYRAKFTIRNARSLSKRTQAKDLIHPINMHQISKAMETGLQAARCR